jgi:hypothetical protein
MINLEQAKELAIKQLLEIEGKSNIKLSLFEDEVLIFEYGWVFFYQSEEFVRTGNLNALVGGNAPILIDKTDGTAHVTGTGKDITYYVDEYCASKKGNIAKK